MLPLALKISPVLGFASTVVPVTGIPHVALFPVKIGVNPGGFSRAVILHKMMRLLPLPFRGKPQGSQGSGKLGGLARKLPEFGSRHAIRPSRRPQLRRSWRNS